MPTAPRLDGSAFAELRRLLATFRRSGARFDRAWWAALDRINLASYQSGHRADDRAATMWALQQTRAEWQAAYEGQPTELPAADALGRLASILADGEFGRPITSTLNAMRDGVELPAGRFTAAPAPREATEWDFTKGPIDAPHPSACGGTPRAA